MKITVTQFQEAASKGGGWGYWGHELRTEKSDHKAIVEYTFQPKNTLTQGKYVKDILSDTSESEYGLYGVNPETTEVLIIYMPKNISEDTLPYDKAALEALTTHKLLIQFFPMTRLVNNPLNHMLQPKFELIPSEQHKNLLEENYARSKTQFPLIRYHHDMVARCLGLIPGDIIKITRPSYSAGEYVSYRTCVP